MVVLTVGFRRISLKLFYVKVLTVTACIQTNERCCISPSFIIFTLCLFCVHYSGCNTTFSGFILLVDICDFCTVLPPGFLSDTY